jgi:putative NADH-flavin reductase
MRIAVFGATGRIGSAVVTEARSRGHEVTAVVRGPRPAIPEGVTTVVAQLDEQDSVRAACAGQDVVVSAIGWTPGQPDDLLAAAARALVSAVEGTRTRLLIVGGAGTLMTPGGRFLDSPDFPADRRRNGMTQVAALDELRRHASTGWTYLCPPAVIAPGDGIGAYRVGTDHMLEHPDGPARISIVDFATAVVDLVTVDEPLTGHRTVAY